MKSRARKKTATRITAPRTSKRNTPAPASVRQPDVAPMRASKQLDAFPTSENAKRRQSSRHKAVVSIRLSGATITRLDDEAKRATEDHTYRDGGWHQWRDVTRSDVIERALSLYLKGGAS